MYNVRKCVVYHLSFKLQCLSARSATWKQKATFNKVCRLHPTWICTHASQIYFISFKIHSKESSYLHFFVWQLQLCDIWKCFLVFLLLSMYKIIRLKNSFEMPYNTQSALELKIEFTWILPFIEIRMAIGVILTGILFEWHESNQMQKSNRVDKNCSKIL